MPGTMRVLAVDGTVTETPYDSDPPLVDIQKAVGGYIEKVPYWDFLSPSAKDQPCVVYCNEDGKVMGLPVNDPATSAWAAVCVEQGLVPSEEHLRSRDHLVGPIVVVFGDEAFMRSMVE